MNNLEFYLTMLDQSQRRNESMTKNDIKKTQASK